MFLPQVFVNEESKLRIYVRDPNVKQTEILKDVVMASKLFTDLNTTKQAIKHNLACIAVFKYGPFLKTDHTKYLKTTEKVNRTAWQLVVLQDKACFISSNGQNIQTGTWLSWWNWEMVKFPLHKVVKMTAWQMKNAGNVCSDHVQKEKYHTEKIHMPSDKRRHISNSH